jgi:hypothetical protein
MLYMKKVNEKKGVGIAFITANSSWSALEILVAEESVSMCDIIRKSLYFTFSVLVQCKQQYCNARKNEEENDRRINTQENNLINCSQLKMLILGFPGFHFSNPHSWKNAEAASVVKAQFHPSTRLSILH